MECIVHMTLTRNSVLDGFTATTKIRELESNGTIYGRLPIIALTANVSGDNEDKCRAAGMDQFLSKPLTLSRKIIKPFFCLSEANAVTSGLQSCIGQYSCDFN